MIAVRKTFFAVGLLCLGSLITLGAQATADSSGLGHGRQLARVLQGLELTADQQAQAREIRETLQSQHQAQRQQQSERRDDLLAMLGAAQVDREAIHAHIDAQAEEKIAFAHDMADMILDLHATLDDAQRTQLVEAVSQGMEHAAPHHGPRRGAHSHDEQ